MSEEGIRGMIPEAFDDMVLSEEEILNFFGLCDASWLHNGDPKRPHAELTSGKCSNAFFDCLRVLKHTNLNEILARQLVKRLNQRGIRTADWVIGSAYTGFTFSYEVARAFRAIHWFVEKDPADPKGKRMIWPRLTIPSGAKVLQVEELVTTAGTLNEVRRAVHEGNADPVEFLPVVGVLVHRPPKLPVDYGEGKEIIALVEKEVWAVDPKDCPLCKVGSPRLRPKTHWARLTGKI